MKFIRIKILKESKDLKLLMYDVHISQCVGIRVQSDVPISCLRVSSLPPPLSFENICREIETTIV